MNNRESAPLIGFKDRMDPYLLRYKYVEAAISQEARRNGWKEYSPPTLERPGTYDKEVTGYLGTSLDNDGFIRCYIQDDTGKPTVAIIVPEGTASLCRRLAWDILENGYKDFSSRLPMKIFYDMNCYRDEEKEEITPTKGKQFGQVGFEFIGSEDIESDIEVIEMAYRSLKEIEVPKETVSVRMGDVGLLNSFIRNMDDGSMKKKVRGYLDLISKSRVSGDKDTMEGNIRLLREIMTGYAETDLIEIMCESSGNQYLNEIENKLNVSIPKTENIITALNSKGIRTYLDPALSRGWMYYTGPVWQIDIIDDNTILPEIAGGGRFDGLVGGLLRKYGMEGIDVPATGFAFGTERLVKIFETYAKPGKKIVVFDLSEGWE